MQSCFSIKQILLEDNGLHILVFIFTEIHIKN